MAIDPIDLPALAQLFAPMATAAMLGPAVGQVPEGLQGDVAKTQAWLATLDDASAKSLLKPFSSLPLVAASLARLTDPAPASIDGPWHLVLDIFPAVNRHQFWQHLKELRKPKEKRILVVAGGRQVGKSFTAEYLLAELGRRATGIRVVHQRMDGAGSIENVTHGVLGKLGISIEGAPTLDVQKSSDVAAKKEWWIKETAHWFVEKLHADTGRQIWLALDGHAKNDPHDTLNMFCSAVVELVGRRIYDKNGCRLLLIDYPEALAANARAKVTLREEIKFPTETDIVVFLEGMLGAGAKTDAKAAEIWGRVMQEQEIDRMQSLADELSAVQA